MGQNLAWFLSQPPVKQREPQRTKHPPQGLPDPSRSYSFQLIIQVIIQVIQQVTQPHPTTSNKSSNPVACAPHWRPSMAFPSAPVSNIGRDGCEGAARCRCVMALPSFDKSPKLRRTTCPGAATPARDQFQWI